jgi:hypothetical protein
MLRAARCSSGAGSSFLLLVLPLLFSFGSTPSFAAHAAHAGSQDGSLPHPAPRNAGEVVDRAANYAAGLMARLSRIVAEEHYVQDSNPGLSRVGIGQTQHRELTADFLLVKVDDGSGWLAFRDVFEVNKSQVRDRADRLTRLFVDQPRGGTNAVARARAISEESARYNIGPRRTINNPLLPLAFLQDDYRPRFTFELKGEDRIDGAPARVVEYRESGSPTLIRGQANRDVPANGRFWIDEPTGAIVKAELTTSDTSLSSRITIDYRIDEHLHARVPARMDEEYKLPSGTTTRAVATYDHFREFQVTTEQR